MKQSQSDSEKMLGDLESVLGSATVMDNPELQRDLIWSEEGENMDALASLLGVPYKVVNSTRNETHDEGNAAGATHCTGCRAVVHPWQKRCMICDRVNPSFKPWAKPS